MNESNEACEVILTLLEYVDGDFSDPTISNLTYPNDNTSQIIGGKPTLESLKFYLSSVVNPLLCIFGIIGNIFNVFVLTRKRFQTTLDCSHERVAVIGLIALALSDSLYCVVSLPDAFLGRPKTVTRDIDFLFFYQIYGSGVKDYFIHTSNWLIVLMAVSRYLAICKPLHTRGLLSTKVTLLSIMVISTSWILLTLPNFWTFNVIHMECFKIPSNDSVNVYILDQGYFVRNKMMKLGFAYLWTTVGFFFPVILLIYCNCHLIKSVQESIQMRTLYRVHSRSRKSSHSNNITPTLVAVICMFLFCTSPSEILHFKYYSVGETYAEEVSTAIVFTNVLLTINYSMNFLLYCIVNSRFRDTIRHILRCGPLYRVSRQFSLSANAIGRKRQQQTQITYNVSNSNIRSHNEEGEIDGLKSSDIFQTFKVSSASGSHHSQHGVKEANQETLLSIYQK